MKYEIGLLDKDFDNTWSGLYVIYDSSTNSEVSGVFPCLNDVCAIASFVKFMQEQKDKKSPFSRFVLRTVGVYNLLKHEISSGEGYDIISDDEDYESYFDEVCNLVRNKDEE